MIPQSDILVACDMCVDLIFHGGDVVPEFNQTEKLVDGYVLDLGGSSCIFAVQAAKLGLAVTALGKVGRDMFGDLALGKLNAAGVNTRFVTREPGLRTGISMALCKEGDRAIITHSGSIDALRPVDIPFSLLRNCRHLHIGSFYLLDHLRPSFPDMAREVRANGGTVSLDTNWDPSGRWEGIRELLPHIDIFLPNENELLRIAGTDTLEEALSAIGGLVELVVVKCGEKGAVAFSKGTVYKAAPAAVAYVDGIGAGDSFDAGFLFGLLSGEPIERCLQIGNLCGAYNTTARGGIAGQLGLEQLQSLVRPD